MSIALGGTQDSNKIVLAGSDGLSGNVIVSGYGAFLPTGIAGWTNEPRTISSIWQSSTLTRITTNVSTCDINIATAKAALIYFNFIPTNNSDYLRLRFGTSSTNFISTASYSTSWAGSQTNSAFIGSGESVVSSVKFSELASITYGAMSGTSSSGIFGYIYLNSPYDTSKTASLNGEFCYKMATTPDGLSNAIYAKISAKVPSWATYVRFFMNSGASFTGKYSLLSTNSNQ